MAVNGLYIVQGESNAVAALLKKAHRGWHHQQDLAVPLDETDPLLRNFSDLRDVLNSVNELCDVSPDTFLSPFLDVIRSEQTNGVVTAQALSSVAKFLSYGLIDSSSIKASSAVENIAEAVTHAKFVGSADPSSDEVVLLKILQVLRTLLLTPVGRLLSNESVCEMMQSCFRICFEVALSELLRKAAESTLADMTQLLFTRLPAFKEDIRHPYIRKLVKRAGGLGGKRKRRKTLSMTKAPAEQPVCAERSFDSLPSNDQELKPDVPLLSKKEGEEAPEVEPEVNEEKAALLNDQKNSEVERVTEPLSVQVKQRTRPEFDVVSEGCENTQQSGSDEASKPVASAVAEASPKSSTTTEELDDGVVPDNDDSTASGEDADEPPGTGSSRQRRGSERNVRFVSSESSKVAAASSEHEQKQAPEASPTKTTSHIPYGLPCARELLRFLIALTSPLDRANTESMIVLGLNLLTVALEAGADFLSNYTLLMPLVKNELCRALLQLLDSEKLPVFAATNRVCFLLFEALRTGLKFQLEAYFNKLKSIVVSEQSRISYEQKEMALESIVQLWRIPGLVTELYLNYDCDLYCSNLFEDLTKLLLENAFPVLGLCSTHILSLDALLTVVETIDVNCVYRQAGGSKPIISPNSSCAQLRLPAISGYSVGRQFESSESAKLADLLGVDKSEESATAELEGSTSALLESLLPSSAVRSNRMAPSPNLPSLAEVIERKKQKRILTEGTDLFNQDPKKGIEFLKEKGILKSPLDPADVVVWLRENPRLEKKRIADYICSRKNLSVLDAFVRSFPFENTRLDDALRMFLETFRLPGEAAEISMVMQHFSDHWYRANNEPFNHVDAAFTLAYAVIMLNTDQHNPTVRRNQPPMLAECFKRNLSGTNGGQDFDQEMLEQMYYAIRSEEIVMPAEQTGMVKENYLWKVLLRRGQKKEGEFIHVPAGWNDHDLFGIIWGPAIAALSFVFDKSEQETVLQKALNGYRKCASIAAYYGMSDVFDNLIIHLCKFSTLMTFSEGGSAEQTMELQRSGGLSEMTAQGAEQVAIAFGENSKAQMAAKTMFQLVHTHGDILREGWKNVLDCILHLFRARLLPSSLTEVEDFVDSKGWVSIQRPFAPKIASNRNDSGLLSWFGLGGSSYDARETKPSADQQLFIKCARNVISECHPEQLVTDGKYLTSSALTELINALIQASTNIVLSAEGTKRLPNKKISEQEEDALVLYLELAISVTLENKDRLSQIWPSVKLHLQWLMTSFGWNPLIVERAVVGLLRLANRNLFRLKDDVAEEVLQSLGMLLKLAPPAMFMFSRQIAFGLHELLRTNAANVHRREHWAVLFALLEASGAGAYPEEPNSDRDSGGEYRQSRLDQPEKHAYSDTEPLKTRMQSATPGRNPAASVVDDRGYTSDDPQRRHCSISSLSTLSDRADSAVSLVKGASTEWIHLDHKDAALAQQQQLRQLCQDANSFAPSKIFDRGTVVLRANLARHEPAAFLKVGETLAFLVRDAAHVTPDNFDSCVQCLRSYVEASLDGGRYAAGPLSGDAQNQLRSIVDEKSRRPLKSGKSSARKQMSLSPAANSEEETQQTPPESEQQQLSTSYHQIAFQLLDLCHTLHVKAARIYKSWADGGAEVDASPSALWLHCWRPLLQCIARLCCDCRRQVRMQALSYLVRSFLIPDMQNMGAAEWENCFGEVLFPLVNKLLENLSPMDPIGMEETRVRAMQLISKMLLNHLTPLGSLSSFPALWLRVLDFMDRYLHTERSDLLAEAIPESLKNMILVMDNTGMFQAIPGLYEMTTTRMGTLLPELIAEVMPGPPEPPPPAPQSEAPRSDAPSLPASEQRRVTSRGSEDASSSGAETMSQTSGSGFVPVLATGRVQIAAPLRDFAKVGDTSSSGVSTATVGTASSRGADSHELLKTDSQSTSGDAATVIHELEEVVVHSGAASPVQQIYQHYYHSTISGPLQQTQPVAGTAAVGVAPPSSETFFTRPSQMPPYTQATAPPHLAHAQQAAALIHSQSPLGEYRYAGAPFISSSSSSSQFRRIQSPVVDTVRGASQVTAPAHLLHSQIGVGDAAASVPQTRPFPLVPSPTSAFSPAVPTDRTTAAASTTREQALRQ